jgi:putative nucleotidyltransferase with HDIG domain
VTHLLRRPGFLTTRIARRVLLSFIACALLPVATLAVIANGQVTRHLREQSEARLREETKTSGMGVIQRLLLLDAELVVLGRDLEASGARERVAPTARFARIAVVDVEDAQIAGLPADVRERLATGEPTLLRRTPGSRSVTLARLLTGEAHRARVAIGDIAADFLAQSSHASNNGGFTCVLDEHRTPLACPADAADEVLTAVADRSGDGQRAAFELETETDTYVAAAWPIYLSASFGGESWVAVATEEHSAVYGAVRDFQRLLALAFLLAIVTVLFLSHIQIRRSLEPVERLREGTRRIGARDFDARVDIRSGDEFEQLGAAFNTMAGNLGLQFRTLATRAELDRAVLSSLDEATIVGTVLERGRGLVPASAMAVVTLSAATATARVAHAGAMTETSWTVPDDALGALRRAGAAVSIADGTSALVPPRLGEPHDTWTAAPMRHGGTLTGWLLFRHGAPLDDDTTSRARGLADQVAIALSNAHLVRTIDDLRWGALHALARAVDAKSAWTAGHSERVTSYAVALGQRLGLTDAELDQLRRGGLIHDVGKIGVPAEVLDKPGRLTDEDWVHMRAHPTIGARILEPLGPFHDVVPIVLHHHEKWDGTGYPAGLAGVDIPYFARIMAVADVFDALTSDRPYRAGMERAVALNILRKDSGTHFDAAIAAVFIEMMEEEEACPTFDPADRLVRSVA